MSRFKESLGFIKAMMTDFVYQPKHESDFNREFVEDYQGDTQILVDARGLMRDDFQSKYPSVPHPMSDFYDNLYAAFLFSYEIEQILDEIDINGLSLSLADSLMNLCGILSINSSNAMISIDDEFSFAKKYSLLEDIHIMTKAMYETMMLYHSASIHEDVDDRITVDTPLEATRYDVIENRMNCKYIRNSLSVMKVFHILALLRVSPLYSDGVHSMAGRLISSLREVLYDKRIMKVVVDSDLYGNNNKPHKTTRLKIYFVMGNSDRYCIRLDLPHDGEECIHLNLNEPSIKQSSGFPFEFGEFREYFDNCIDEEAFERLFYKHDELFWFRSGFAKLIKDVSEEDAELKKRMERFLHDRAHLMLAPSENDEMDAAIDFSGAFAEAMMEYGFAANVYGDTDSDDYDIYQYMLFEDFLFDVIIKIRHQELGRVLELGSRKYELSAEEMTEVDRGIKEIFCEYIQEKFPNDDELNVIASDAKNLSELYEGALDCLDKIGL